MRRPPILPTIVVLLAVAAMIALGLWQLQRRTEKAALIAHAAANLHRAPVPLPLHVTDDLLFARVTATCATPGAWTLAAGRSVDDAPGYRHILTCRDPRGRAFRIDMGVAADPAVRPVWRGGAITGTLTQAPGGPTLLDQMTGRATSPEPMIVADVPAPGLSASRRPDPANLPDNHMAYAIQWFAFAFAAVVIYLLALRRRSR